MADTRSEKRIDELVALSEELKEDSVFAVVQDGLTRKVSLKSVKESFSEGDPSYYTSDDIDDLLQIIHNRFNDLLKEFNILQQEFVDFKDDITDQMNALQLDFDNFKVEMRNEIQNLHDIIDDLFDYGTAVPTSLREGKFYLQWFN